MFLLTLATPLVALQSRDHSGVFSGWRYSRYGVSREDKTRVGPMEIVTSYAAVIIVGYSKGLHRENVEWTSFFVWRYGAERRNEPKDQ
jgi:hypothetical protein